MKMEIDKIDVSMLGYERFVSQYLKPEKPVVITGVNTFDLEKLTVAYMKKHYQDPSHQEAGWFTSKIVEDGVIRIPDIVKRTLQRVDISLREFPLRLFMHPKGNFTLPHYDASSLNGLNQQVLGRKRWVLTSPFTPIPSVPFMFAGAVGRDFRYDETQYDFYDFETVPGDILFLPRYWYHEVHALEEINLNLNWVFTPNTPNQSSPLGRREVELVKLRKTFPIIDRLSNSDKFLKYGGKGQELINTYSDGVSYTRMFCRLLKELGGYPRLLFVVSQIKQRAKALEKNNFNIKSE